MTKGMVVAPQPEAVEAGLETLKNGGNMIDAAVSAAFVKNAVDPQNGWWSRSSSRWDVG